MRITVAPTREKIVEDSKMATRIWSRFLSSLSDFAIRGEMVKEVTGGYVVNEKDRTVVVNSSSPVSITMPTPVGSGMEYVVKNIGSGTVTVGVSVVGESIDAGTTVTLAQWEKTRLLDHKENKWVTV